MARRPAARSGMALILALAAVVLAGGLALYLQARAATLFRAEQTELRWEQLRLSAAEAAREALWVLAADDDLTVDHLAEDWALPRETNRTDGIVTHAMVEDAGRFLNWNNVGVSGRSGRSARDMLLDLLMPVMDGFEVLASMNRSHMLENLPVIMISSEDSDAFIRRA